MQSRGLLLAAGVGALLLFVITNVPARLGVDLLRSAGVQAGSASGTLWRGEVASLRVAGLGLGRTRWVLHPLSLLTGRLSADIDTELPGGFIRGRAEAGLGGRLALIDTEAASPLSNLAPLLGLPIAGGEANASIQRLVVEDNWPTVAVAELRVGNLPLALPGMMPEPGAIGSFAAVFDLPELAAGDPLVGELRDLGGALEIDGNISLSPPNNYDIAGLLKPRDSAPPSLTQGLVLFGPEDAQGRREFSLSGSF
jgi:hypothetical protein